jgi:hypothetical protein
VWLEGSDKLIKFSGIGNPPRDLPASSIEYVYVVNALLIIRLIIVPTVRWPEREADSPRPSNI